MQEKDNSTKIAITFPERFFVPDIWTYTSQYLDYPSLSALNKVNTFFKKNLKSIAPFVIAQGDNTLLLHQNYLHIYGSHTFSQPPQGYQGDSSSFTHISFNSPKTPRITIQEIAIGSHHILVLLSNGQLFGKGKNDSGQLGQGNLENCLTFKEIGISGVKNGVHIVKIAAGQNHSLVLLSNGQLMGCGFNFLGQLGLGAEIVRSLYFKLIIINQAEIQDAHIIDIKAEANQSIAILSNGKMISCGLSFVYPEIIFHYKKIVSFPTNTGLLNSNIKQMMLRNNCMIILLSNGQLFGAGPNIHRLGFVKQYEHLFIELKISKLENGMTIEQFAVGDEHLLLLLSDGQVLGYGSNESGQLGLGRDLKQCSTFTPIKTGVDGVSIRQIAAGNKHSLVVLDNKQLLSAGENHKGQLGSKNTQECLFVFTPVTSPFSSNTTTSSAGEQSQSHGVTKSLTGSLRTGG